MQTMIILLNPAKLTNPDLDLRYCVPDRIVELFGGEIQSDGYDYIETNEGQAGPLMGIWLKTENASVHWSRIVKLFQEEKFKENDLSLTAEIYISEEEAANLEQCKRVHPQR